VETAAPAPDPEPGDADMAQAACQERIDRLQPRTADMEARERALVAEIVRRVRNRAKARRFAGRTVTPRPAGASTAGKVCQSDGQGHVETHPALHAAGRIVAVLSRAEDGGFLQVLDARTGEVLRSWPAGEDPRALSIRADGGAITNTGDDGKLIVWELSQP